MLFPQVYFMNSNGNLSGLITWRERLNIDIASLCPSEDAKAMTPKNLFYINETSLNGYAQR